MGDLSKGQEDVEIIFRGIVFKLARNGRMLPSWHRRYAVLNSEGQLYLYTDETMRSVRRVIDLQNLCLRIKFAEDTTDDYCNKWPKRTPKTRRISLINMDRTYHFYTDTDEEAVSWKDAFASTAGTSSNWTLETALKRPQTSEQANGLSQLLPHAVLNLQDEEGDHVSETILTVGGDEREESDREDNENLQPLEPPTSGGKLMNETDDSGEEEEFSGYDEVGPREKTTLKDKIALFEKHQEEDGEQRTSIARSTTSDGSTAEIDSEMGQSKETLDEDDTPTEEEDPAPLHADTKNEEKLPVKQEELPPPPGAEEKEELSSQHKDPERSKPVLDYSSQVQRLSQRRERTSRRRNSSTSSTDKRPLSPPKDQAETSGDDPSAVVGPPIESSTPLKPDRPPSSPTHQLVSVPEDTLLSPSTTGSVMDRIKAFGKPAPPPSAFLPNHGEVPGRHRRVSEPVKTTPSNKIVLPETVNREGTRKQEMTKFASASAVGSEQRDPLPWEENEQGTEPQDRVQMAAKWVDKELRKLIQEIQRLGAKNSDGLWEVKFGVLFEETANIFEALSGILKTAKKHKIVTYKGELLFQSYHDNVVITLIKEEVEDADIGKYTTANPKGMKRDDLPETARKKTSGFSQGTAFTGDSKCAICGKKVYATEFVAANDQPLHKTCFKCIQCGKKLTTSTFATIENKFYCLTHYERMYKEKGGYDFS